MKLGWLSPTEFFPCKLCEHTYVAHEFCEKLGYTYDSCPNDVLIEHGWVHITKSIFFGDYHIFWQKKLNDYQRNFLRPYMESGRVNPINVDLFNDEDE